MTRKMLFLAPVVCALLLAACTLGPPYSRPEAPVPAHWPDGPAYQAGDAASGTLAADLPWRQFFTDARLQQVIAAALENNRDLRLAALNVERAREYYRIQRADVLPRVDGTAAASQQHLPADLSSSGQSATTEKYSLDLGISSWEIDFFGRIRSLEQAALEAYLATEEARRAAQILLIAEIANGWLSLAADQDKLDLARSTLEAQQAAYHLIRRRSEVGLAQELDLRRAQTQVETARVDLARFTEAVARGRNALNLLAGAPVPANLWPEGLDGIGAPEGFIAGASSQVLLNRPDILAAEGRLRAANANIGAARAALFPRITLTTTFGLASADLSDLFSAGQDAWSFAPRLTLPIFDPRLRAAVRVTRVEQKIVLANYEKTIQTAFREVSDALAQRAAVGGQLAAQQSLVEATAEVHRLSNARYLKGVDSYLNILDAQRSLYAAQQGLVTVRLADLATRVKLYAVLGGGA